MWRWLLLVLLVAAISMLAAFAPVWFPAPEPSNALSFPAPAETEGPRPKALVEPENLVFDFGVLSKQTESVHKWIVKNEGEGSLKLKKGDSSCSCTIASLPEDMTEYLLQPGKSVPIELKWHTKDVSGQFLKHASIITSDPDHSEIKFVIKGTVRPAVIVLPENSMASFEDFSPTQSPVKDFLVYSPDKADFEITGMASSRTEFLELSSTKVSQDDLDTLVKLEQTTSQAEDKERFKALAGFKIGVRVKSGMPIGGFKEDLQLSTNHPKHPRVNLVVVGRVVGPISISPVALNLSHISGAKGGKGSVNLFVRGQEKVNFTITKIPSPLTAAFTPIEDKARSKVASCRYLLTVTVPPGTPPMSIHAGSIEFTTDHPEAPKMVMPLDVIVEAH